jgi:hypothetical protein
MLTITFNEHFIDNLNCLKGLIAVLTIKAASSIIKPIFNFKFVRSLQPGDQYLIANRFKNTLKAA